MKATKYEKGKDLKHLQNHMRPQYPFYKNKMIFLLMLQIITKRIESLSQVIVPVSERSTGFISEKRKKKKMKENKKLKDYSMNT